MSSNVSVFETALSSLRSLSSLIHDGGCKRKTKIFDQQHEKIDIPPLQPQKRQRKSQTSPCVNSKNINSITDWLKSDDITVIGIYGMGGIGKTTLAKHIYDELCSGGVCYAIGWVYVELDFTVYQLQKQIAATFGIDLEGDTDVCRRAAALHTFLSRTGKKFILFLDDLWSNFRREDVGIPRNCKLIVVSCLLDVCRALRCQEIIKVEPLTEEESWELFHHSIRSYGVAYSEKMSCLKKLVYDESAGLPLAINMLAKNMMGVVDAASKWSELSLGPTQTECVLNRLKLSYDRLNNIKLQHCFSCCASYPEGYAINKEELIGLWIEKGLIDSVPEAQLDMGYTILNKLINSCLLEACDDTNSIRMHDLVRRMARLIALR